MSTEHHFEIKVRYVETDAMGFVHHSAYLPYFEAARIEFLSSVGFPYHQLEQNGIFIPVLSAHIDYRAPAHFGDSLSIVFSAEQIGLTKVEFNYKAFCKEKLICECKTTHAFMNKEGRPIRPPEGLWDVF